MHAKAGGLCQGVLAVCTTRLQGNISMTGVMDILWHEKKPDRIFFQGKVQWRRVCLQGGRAGALASHSPRCPTQLTSRPPRQRGRAGPGKSGRDVPARQSS